MVLIVSAVIYLAISTLFLLIMTEIHLADFEQRSTQAFYLAESAITKGVVRLRANHKNHHVLNDLIAIGGRQHALTTTFIPKPCGNDNTAKAWYALNLQGLGVVTGQQTATRRKVGRDVVLKPFALLAKRNITLQNLCHISGPNDTNGNLHGNGQVIIGDHVNIEGDASSSTGILISSNATVTGDSSQKEPWIAFPDFSVPLYIPKYAYHGEEYQAQPLSLLSFPSADGTSRLDIYYKGSPNDENPAGIYILPHKIADNIGGTMTVFTTFDIQGTVIVQNSFALRGRVRINPAVDHFPAFISSNGYPIEMTFIDRTTIEAAYSDLDVEDLALIPDENSIQGAIYSRGDIGLTAFSDSAKVAGSMFGQNIALNGNSTIEVTYDPGIMTDPPPGLQLVDYGAWREIIE